MYYNGSYLLLFKKKIDKVALHPKPQKLNELRGRL